MVSTTTHAQQNVDTAKMVRHVIKSLDHALMPACPIFRNHYVKCVKMGFTTVSAMPRVANVWTVNRVIRTMEHASRVVNHTTGNLCVLYVMTDSMAQRVLIYVVIVLMATRVIKIQDFVRKDAILTLSLHSAKDVIKEVIMITVDVCPVMDIVKMAYHAIRLLDSVTTAVLITGRGISVKTACTTTAMSAIHPVDIVLGMAYVTMSLGSVQLDVRIIGKDQHVTTVKTAITTLHALQAADIA